MADNDKGSRKAPLICSPVKLVLLPGRLAEIDVVLVGQRAAGCADGAADDRAAENAATREGADAGTRCGAETATAERAIALRLTAGGETQ